MAAQTAYIDGAAEVIGAVADLAGDNFNRGFCSVGRYPVHRMVPVIYQGIVTAVGVGCGCTTEKKQRHYYQQSLQLHKKKPQ